MKIIKNNIAWFAPTLAIVFFATIYLMKDGELSLLSPGDPQQEAADLEIKQLADFNASVQASLEAQKTAVAVPAAPQVDQTNSEVSRTALVDLLAVNAVEKPQAVVAPQTTALSNANAADFFANAKANISTESSCKDDLAELASSTKIYFPAGGLSAEDAGLAAARLIGMVARDCPGYAVQVEGHSDPSGDPGANQVLSQKRAEAVIKRLSASGIDTSNFVAVGYGDTRPSNVQGSEGSAFYDRRVEFSVVMAAQKASWGQAAKPWQAAASDCVGQLEQKAELARQYFAPNAITVSASQLDAVFNLAADVARCDGAWLRIVGQHTDEPGSRETAATGRMRALAMLSTLTTAGFEQDRILIAAPSYSVAIAGQPGLPNSRVDFQIVSD